MVQTVDDQTAGAATRDPKPALPLPRGYEPIPCPLCRGTGLAHLSIYGPRRCPTCGGGGRFARTWLTEGDGMLQRARSIGLGERPLADGASTRHDAAPDATSGLPKTPSPNPQDEPADRTHQP